MNIKRILAGAYIIICGWIVLQTVNNVASTGNIIIQLANILTLVFIVWLAHYLLKHLDN